jgi:hypothetical protein
VRAKTMADERRWWRYTIGVEGETRMGAASGRQTRCHWNDNGKQQWCTSMSDGSGQIMMADG